MVNDLPNIESVWSVNEYNFNALSLQIFQFQVKNNPVYAEYVDLIDKRPKNIQDYRDIPFLPISFFKSRKIVSYDFEPDVIYQSSSTTGVGVSNNFVASEKEYLINARRIFENQVAQLEDITILGLLPNYLERKNSSLISMVNYFIKELGQHKGYYLYDHKSLLNRIESEEEVILFGVSFALLDFAEMHTSTKKFTIIETGGMKGRKREMTKREVYSQIKDSFPNAEIRSEYGMTELMSQAYSDQSATYTCPPWMKVLPRADNDPLSKEANGQTAALNIIDLANLHSCCFIATDDLGKVHSNGRFEVLGRLDYADIRGCSQMVI